MRITTRTRPARQHHRGFVLYVVLIATAILGLSLVSYFGMVRNQSQSVARSRAWNLAIPVAEAGIEEALAQIARNTNAVALAVNNWRLDGNSFVLERTIDGGRFLTRIIPSAPPVIESHGFVQIPYGNRDELERRIRVQTSRNSPFSHALLADGQIDLRGNNISTDSFDSDDPNYSTGKKYDPTKKKYNGNIATNSGLADSINAGNADILGTVSTGYGGSVAIGPNGAVGDETWHTSGSLGIQPGMVSDDMNVAMPTVDAPFTSAVPPPAVPAGYTNVAVLMPGGDYMMSGVKLTGSDVMLITGDTRLYVSGNISLAGSSQIVIEPGASLTIYAAGSTTSFGGGGISNGNGTADSFSYVGLETNTKISYSGNADFVGTIYAPKANLTLGGGGTTEYDFVGSAVVNTITMNGKFKIHYDEALAKSPTPGLYTVVSWNEF